MPSARIDVVVVAYNSRATLRDCVVPLAGLPGVRVTVVDNASPDPALDTVTDLPVDAISAPRNGGFSYGCNLGAIRGAAPYVLFLNPDARIERADLDRLARVLDDEPTTGVVGPRLLDGDGELMFSQRSFPRVASTFAQALFLHRLAPRALWADEVIRRTELYERPGSPEWISGACMLVRRELLERLGGMDEGFFLYSEDTDICARVRAAGFDVRFEPGAVARHEGGHSAPRSALLTIMAESRRRYARKHSEPIAARLLVAGTALSAATHAIAAVGRPGHARGHAAALWTLVAGHSALAS